LPNFVSYLVSSIPQVSERVELAPGVLANPLVGGLGTLQDRDSPITLLFKRTRTEDQSTIIRLSIAPIGGVSLELKVSPVAHEHFFESIEAALAMKMLLSVCGFGNPEIPVAMSHSIEELRNGDGKEVSVTDVDLFKGPSRYRFNDDDPAQVMQRAVDLWPAFMALLYGAERKRFKLALEAIEASRYAYDARFALASLWVAPEAMFGKDPGEATFKLTAAWASFVTERGDQRLALQRRLTKLYGLRSKAVHGHTTSDTDFADAYGETFTRVMNCLWVVVNRGELPAAEELQTRIFL